VTELSVFLGYTFVTVAPK